MPPFWLIASALIVAAAIARAVHRRAGRARGRSTGRNGAGVAFAARARRSATWCGSRPPILTALRVVAQTFARGLASSIKYAGAALPALSRLRGCATAPVDGRATSRRIRARIGGTTPVHRRRSALTLGNSKVGACYLALLPNLIDLARVGIVGIVELAGHCAMRRFSRWSYAEPTWRAAGRRARALLLAAAPAMRLLNRTAGTLDGGRSTWRWPASRRGDDR